MYCCIVIVSVIYFFYPHNSVYSHDRFEPMLLSLDSLTVHLVSVA